MKGSGHGKKRGQSPKPSSQSPNRPAKTPKRSLSTKRKLNQQQDRQHQTKLNAVPTLDAQQQRAFTQMLSPSLNIVQTLTKTSSTTTTASTSAPQTSARAGLSTKSGPVPQWKTKSVLETGVVSSLAVHSLPTKLQTAPTPSPTILQKRQLVTQSKSNLGPRVGKIEMVRDETQGKMAALLAEISNTPTHSTRSTLPLHTHPHRIPRRRFSQSAGSIQDLEDEGSVGEEPTLTFPWSPEEEQESKQVLDTIQDIGAAVKAMAAFIHSEQPIDALLMMYGHHVDVDPTFRFDPDSPFSEAVQRNFLYKALPKSLKKKKQCVVLPEGFDRANFVSMNIRKFHSDSFPSDADILHVFNTALIHEDIQRFFHDLSIEQFARLYGVEFIGAGPELQKSIKSRLERNQDVKRPPIIPAQKLQIFPEQMEALDSLLGFTLPKLTPEHNNQILIAHLKKKAQNLTQDYNTDPFHAQSIRRKHEVEIAEARLLTYQAQLDAEIARYKEKEGENPEEDLKRQELILKRQEILDKLQSDINGQKKRKQLPTVAVETLNTIRKLPPKVTAANIDKATTILKESNPLINQPGVVEQTQRADALKKRQAASKKPSWLRNLSNHYQLTKPRISQMVGVTALWGYWSVGNPTNLTDVALLTTGTMALSSSASIINQIRETDVDSKMTRTMSRPLVTKAISIESAKKQAIGYAAVGASLLFPFTTIVPVLGLSNIALYGGLYTSLKRTTPLNTEVGAIVGAIPPMMGYFAALSATQGWDHNLTALCYPAAMMIAWQIQHVMLICVRRGEEYNRSGLVMQCKDDPGLKTTINKGIAWSVISTVVSSIPFFTGHADLTQLFATYCWAVYTIPYAIAMKKQDHKRLGQVLLAGYVVLGLTILFSLNSQVPADAWSYLFVDGPATPSPLPDEPPTLTDVLIRGAGKVGKGALDTLQNLAVDDVADDVVEAVTPSAAALPNANPGMGADIGGNGNGNGKMASVADVMTSNKSKLTQFTEWILNMNSPSASSQDDV